MLSFFQSRQPVLQQTVDPIRAEIPKLRDAEIAAIFYGQRMGGDFYDFRRVSPDRVLFGLLDVAGRRDQNRAILSAAQEIFRDSGSKLFDDGDVNEAEAMIELCHQLNRCVMQSAGGVRSCPAFAGCYNETLGTICYTNSGHTPGLLRDDSGVTLLPATGLPLGLFSHIPCDAPTVALPAGAALLLVSRGVVESHRNGEDFGLERLSSHLRLNRPVSAKDLGLSVLNNVQQFMCTPPTHDDVTALALVRGATTGATTVSAASA